MLSNKKEERTFSNGPLRDQWEKRAQSIADQCKQDEEFKQKSSVKLLFSKWTYHWSLTADAEMSDFSKLNRIKEEEDKKPKIRFKIGPPPPKPKPDPPPPPPPPRRKALPKSRRPKRKVEVDVFGLCWKESWKSLKPPKYLYLKSKESKSRIPRFTCIEVSDNRKYKATIADPDTEQTDDKWSQSWKQVKSPVLYECSEEKLLPWEIIFERKVTNSAEIENYSLPLWARTWKYINFAFRQEKQKWDRIWSIYQQNIFAETQNLQIDEQAASSGWKNSWKLHPADPAYDTTVMVQVFQPGWKRSWLFSASPLDEKEELNQDWWSCWGYWQLLRWCKASWDSHRRYSDTLTRRRKSTNLFLTSPLDDEFYTTEWEEAWRSPKGSQRSETYARFETEEEEDEEEDKDMDEVTDKYAKKVKEEEEYDEDKVKVDDEDLLEEVEDEDDDDSDAVGKDGEDEEEKEDKNQDNEKVDEDDESNEEDEDEEEDELDKEERDKEAVEEQNKNEEEFKEEDEAEVDEEDEEEDEAEEEEDEDEDAVVDEEDEAEVDEEDEAEEEDDEAEEEEEDEAEEEEEDEAEKDEDNNDGEVDLKEKDFSDQQDKLKEVSEDEVSEEEVEEETMAITTEGDKETAPEKQEDKKEEKMKERLRRKRRNVPLHLQFHKLNKTLSSWTQSWILAFPYRGGDYEQENEEEDDELSAWKDSWKICRLKKQEDDVEFLSTDHTSPKLFRMTDEEDEKMKNEWTMSWKMNQPSAREEGEEEDEEEDN